jgi:hypothetical protein
MAVGVAKGSNGSHDISVRIGPEVAVVVTEAVLVAAGVKVEIISGVDEMDAPQPMRMKAASMDRTLKFQVEFEPCIILPFIPRSSRRNPCV